MNNIMLIEQHPEYKRVLADSFGGILYNVANRDKYDADGILAIWDSMTEQEQSSVGGIMKGAINFLKEK